MSTDELIKEIDELQDSIDRCPNMDQLKGIYDKFGNTTVTYANKEKKVFEPHYWVCFGKQILKNLNVTVERNG